MLCVVAWLLWFLMLWAVRLVFVLIKTQLDSSAGVFPVWARVITTTSVSEKKKILAVKFKLGTLCKEVSLFNLMMVLHFRRLSKSKTLPPRPPPAKTGPGRPPPPSLQTTGRSHSASWDASPKQKPHRKGPVLPPRPNPGHCLYNKYTVREIPLHNWVL